MEWVKVQGRIHDFWNGGCIQPLKKGTHGGDTGPASEHRRPEAPSEGGSNMRFPDILEKDSTSFL
jgi:hypothetical protein